MWQHKLAVHGKLTLPRLLDLAAPLVAELGVDAQALGMGVRLHKLVVHEQHAPQGGGLLSHKREAGMFATMILQLPTQFGHQGGEVSVSYEKSSTCFDFSGPRSSVGYSGMVFFCDCQCRVTEVTDGIKLCLVFDLVRSNPRPVDVDAAALSNYISALGRVQAILRNLVKEKVAISLGHRYSSKDLSFAGLRGYDRVVAALVLSCTGFLDVHLCELVKMEKWEEYWLSEWTTVEDIKAQHLKPCQFYSEDIVDEGYKGNHIGDDDRFESCSYYTAALVVWPRDFRMNALCITQSAQDVLTLIEEEHLGNPEGLSLSLESLISAYGVTSGTWSCEKVLEFAIRHEFRTSAFTAMRLWALSLMEKPDAGAMISAIRKYGWEMCYSEVIRNVLESKDYFENLCLIAGFPECLRRNGFHDAAVLVAKKILIHSLSFGSAKLMKFFLETGLEHEVWQMLRLSPLDLSVVECVLLVVKNWGMRSLPPIKVIFKEALKDRLGSKQRTKMFLQVLAKVVLSLHDRGLEDAAIFLASKNVIDMEDVNLEEISGDDTISPMVAMSLLLCFDEKLHHLVMKVKPADTIPLLRYMREAASLIGLKKDAGVTQLFAELIVRCYSQFEKEALDMVFWLGDRMLVDKVQPQLMATLQTANIDRLIIAESTAWDQTGRMMFKEVLQNRMRIISQDRIYEDSEEETDSERETDSEDECNNLQKRRKLNARDERIKMDKEIQQIQNILDIITVEIRLKDLLNRQT